MKTIRDKERAEHIQRNKELVSQYKTDIDLTTYLQDVGFVIDRKRSTSRWPVLIDPINDRRLIVVKSRRNNEYFYYNPNDDQDKGTIIDMMAEKMRVDLSGREGWSELHKAASGMLGNAYYEENNAGMASRISRQATGHIDDSREAALSQYFRLDPLKNTHYLEHERRLSPDVIFAPEFANKLFNQPFVDTTFQNAGKNTVFPIENENGVIGIITRSTNWNQIKGVKDNGVWISNIAPNTRNLVITEAPIDAMAYHQLHQPTSPLDTAYLATAGTITSGQKQTMQFIINNIDARQLTLANDNDFQGIRNNVNLAGKLTMPGQPETGYAVGISNNNHSNTLTIEVDWEKARRNPDVPHNDNELAGRIHAIMNRGYAEGEQRTSIQYITQTDSVSQLKVNFPNIRPLLIRAENLTVELRQCKDRIIIKRAQENDFSQELMLREIKKQVLEQHSIKLSNAQAETLISTRKSPIILDKELNAGKLILEYTREGMTPVFVARQQELVIPDQFRNQPINQQDAANLKQTGEMGRRVETESPINQEIQPGYIGVERELNTLVFLKSDLMRTSNVFMAELSTPQLKDIVAGKTVDTIMKGRNSMAAVQLRIEAGSGEITMKKIDPLTGKLLEKGENKTVVEKKTAQQKPLLPGAKQVGGIIKLTLGNTRKNSTQPNVLVYQEESEPARKKPPKPSVQRGK